MTETTTKRPEIIKYPYCKLFDVVALEAMEAAVWLARTVVRLTWLVRLSLDKQWSTAGLSRDFGSLLLVKWAMICGTRSPPAPNPTWRRCRGPLACSFHMSMIITWLPANHPSSYECSTHKQHCEINTVKNVWIFMSKPQQRQVSIHFLSILVVGVSPCVIGASAITCVMMLKRLLSSANRIFANEKMSFY